MNSEINTNFEDEQDYCSNVSNHAIKIVSLTSSQVSDALELSQRLTEPGKRWSIYLNGLALAGFRQWLTTRTMTFNLDETDCMILAPPIADGIAAVCHLRAGPFHLCLIGSESPSRDNIQIPQLVLDYPKFMAHFYLPITVYEEQAAISLQGFFRIDQIMRYQSDQPLSPGSDQNYSLPTQWLESDLDALLLYFNCLDPEFIPLPQTSPPVLPKAIHQILVQPVVNTAQWFYAAFTHQVEGVVQQLKWVVMPPYAFASAMRELPNFLEWRDLAPHVAPISEIESPNTSTPSHSNAYCQFDLGEINLQLHAIVRLLESTVAELEWSLLLLLKHQADQPLPDGLILEVRDLQTMQVVQRMQVSSAAGCLFTEVIGMLSEQFLVTISLNDGISITLPTLKFQPSAS